MDILKAHFEIHNQLMAAYFQNSLDDIEAFTHTVRYQVDFVCPHCKAKGQTVSHGHLFGDNGIIIGKRCICDRRRGGTGCGKTIRILIKSKCYRLHYALARVGVFLSALLCCTPVLQAYQEATGTCTSRNSWRWWKKLKNREGDLRQELFALSAHQLPHAANKTHQDIKKATHLERISSLLKDWTQNQTMDEACANFQLITQKHLL